MLLAAAYISGCGQGVLDPASTGGVPLEGSRGIDAQGGAPFSLSADGRWLSFALEVPLPEEFDDTPAALAQLQLERLRQFRLFDRKSGGIVQPAVPPDTLAFVLTGGFPLSGAGCWQEGALVLRTAASGVLHLDPESTPPAWRPVHRSGPLPGCPFPDRRSLGPGDYGPLRLHLDNDRGIVLMNRRSGRRLAVHQPGWLPGMAVQVSYLEMSPDGKRVAYGILDHFGSFVGNTTLYVLNLAGGTDPRALASPVYFARWSPDGLSLYGHVKSSDSGASAYAIYRWTPAR